MIYDTLPHAKRMGLLTISCSGHLRKTAQALDHNIVPAYKLVRFTNQLTYLKTYDLLFGFIYLT
jgi:hypothetical protein